MFQEKNEKNYYFILLFFSYHKHKNTKQYLVKNVEVEKFFQDNNKSDLQMKEQQPFIYVKLVNILGKKDNTVLNLLIPKTKKTLFSKNYIIHLSRSKDWNINQYIF